MHNSGNLIQRFLDVYELSPTDDMPKMFSDKKNPLTTGRWLLAGLKQSDEVIADTTRKLSSD